jgi:hypothetical protein
MVIACAAAVTAPFHLFLFAYAALGPLHYLTEISWLHDRQYFASRPRLRRLWLTLVVAAIAAVAFGYVSSEVLAHPIPPKFEIGLVYLAFIGAAVAVFATYSASAIAVLTIGGAAVLMFASYPQFGIVAFLLVTIVHVLLFTGCFILYGATKSKRRSGYASFGVFCVCVVASVALSGAFVPVGGMVREAYAPFEQLNHVLLRLGGKAGAPVYGGVGVRVMQMIAFAYTYHYLNWFSKTSVIGWHEVPRRRALAIVVVWAASIAIYLYDYHLGFAVLYVLSVLHVLLEFPLNHHAFVGLLRSARLPMMRRAATAG